MFRVQLLIITGRRGQGRRPLAPCAPSGRYAASLGSRASLMPRSPPARQLTLQLHGSVQLLADGQMLRTGSRRALAMAVMSAVEGEMARDRLADLLWPGSDRAKARRDVRRDLFRLRELGLPLDDRGRDAVALPPLEIAWPRPEIGAPNWLPDLEDAGGAELDEWLTVQRARLHAGSGLAASRKRSRNPRPRSAARRRSCWPRRRRPRPRWSCPATRPVGRPGCRCPNRRGSCGNAGRA